MEAQKLIREQQEGLQEYLKDLYQWEDDIKKKDAELIQKAKSGKLPTREIPPIRATVKFTEEGTKSIPAVPASSSATAQPQTDNITQANAEKDKGNELFNKGKYTEAVECYSRSIKLDPTNPIFPANRAMAHLKLQNFTAAEADSTMSLTIDPTYVKAYLRRGVARQSMGQLDLAIKDFEHSLKLEPTNKSATEELAKTKALRSRPQVATASTPSPTSSTPSAASPSTTPAPKPTPINPNPASASTPTPTSTSPNPSASSPSTTSVPATSAGVQKLSVNEDKASSPTPAPKVPVPVKATGPIATKAPVSKQSLEALVSHMKPTLPSDPPTTSYEFDRVWRSILKDNDLIYQYIKMIPPTKLAPIFRDSMSSEVFNAFISTLTNKFLPNGEAELGVQVLSNLCKVGRFDMLLMFLSGDQKLQVKKLFDGLQSAENVAKDAVPAFEDAVAELRKKYAA